MDGQRLGGKETCNGCFSDQVLMEKRSLSAIEEMLFLVFLIMSHVFCCLCVQVTAQWLLDLEKFNEWMSEEDYMVDDDFDVSFFFCCCCHCCLEWW